jgi:hypothetical protein
MNTDWAGLPGRRPTPEKPLFPHTSGYFREFGFFLSQADQAELGTNVRKLGSGAANRLFPLRALVLPTFSRFGPVP